MLTMPATEAGTAGARVDSRGAIFVRFLKFGGLAWGGPAAQIAMIKRECVDEEGWVSEETFKKTLAVYQVLPGPEAHELCVYFGRIRGGKLGGFLAGLGFMLPGFLLMLALSVLYVEAELAGNLDELFYGLKAAVVAIIARALVRLSRTFITDVPLAVLALAALALTLFADAAFVIVLLGAGLLYELDQRPLLGPAERVRTLLLPLLRPPLLETSQRGLLGHAGLARDIRHGHRLGRPLDRGDRIPDRYRPSRRSLRVSAR